MTVRFPLRATSFSWLVTVTVPSQLNTIPPLPAAVATHPTLERPSCTWVDWANTPVTVPSTPATARARKK